MCLYRERSIFMNQEQDGKCGSIYLAQCVEGHDLGRYVNSYDSPKSNQGFSHHDVETVWGSNEEL